MKNNMTAVLENTEILVNIKMGKAKLIIYTKTMKFSFSYYYKTRKNLNRNILVSAYSKII